MFIRTICYNTSNVITTQEGPVRKSRRKPRNGARQGTEGRRRSGAGPGETKSEKIQVLPLRDGGAKRQGPLRAAEGPRGYPPPNPDNPAASPVTPPSARGGGDEGGEEGGAPPGRRGILEATPPTAARLGQAVGGEPRAPDCLLDEQHRSHETGLPSISFT